MPKKHLNDAWRKVTARFDILDRHRDVIMQMMGAAWRRWRAEIKAKSYDPNTPLDELVSIRPVPQKLALEVWEALCHYWNTNEFQEKGRKPTRIEIIKISRRSKKRGDAPVDDEVRVEALLDEAARLQLQDKPEGTQPTEVHEDAFRL
ncbi:hypothetical protein ZIOFF_020158 [Zingiber officinale]|uniref:Uncharacterized protein n=1 Tax=Zingiber officinale TaxID=94328 RepID=A0A8J5HF81_ZINOF|nr:hypothetical protein ZIOFF_020158 [Zingiber officinale]